MSMSNFRPSFNIRGYRWLPLLIILANLLALVGGAILLRDVEQRLVSAAGEDLMIAAVEVSDKLDRLLFERYGDVQTMAHAFSSRVADVRYLSSYLDRVKTNYAPLYHWLGVMNAQGVMVAATDPALRGRNFGQAGWFKHVREAGKIVIDDVGVREDGDRGIETVAFTSPILNAEGRFLGAVTTRVPMSVLKNLMTGTVQALEARKEFAGPVNFQMVSELGTVFVDSDLLSHGVENIRELEQPSVRIGESGRPGFFEGDYFGRPVVTAYARTKGFEGYSGFGWYVVARMDRDIILRPVNAILWKVGLAGAVVWLPMMALLFWSITRLRAEYRQAQQESSWARAAEAALQQSQERNRAIVETAFDALVTIDAAGVVSDWNSQASAIFGWSREEAVGQRLSNLMIPPRDREAHERGLHHFLATGETHILNRRIELLALHKAGHEFPVELAISPVRIGDAIFFSAFLRDITDRREAEKKLKESEARYRSVVNALDEGVVVIDGAGHMRTGNASAERILGLSQDELNGRSLHDAYWRTIREDGLSFPPEQHPAVITLLTGQPCAGVVMGLHRPDGKLRWLEVNSRPLSTEEHGSLHDVVLSFSDITERKRAEGRMTTQYAITRVLAESRTMEAAVPKIMQAIGENLDWDCGIFWRVDKNAMVLRCLDQWHSQRFTADVFLAKAWDRSFNSGEGLPGRIWAIGTAVWIADVLKDHNFLRQEPAREVGFHGAFGFPIRVGGEIEGVVEFYTRKIRVSDEELLKLIDDIGLKLGQFGERTRAEEALQQTEVQLRQSQKMEAVGRLAGGVAHDFNNLLTVIRGYSELLLGRMGPEDAMRKDLLEVKKAADRASGLTRQLLAFSRRQFIAPKVIDLNSLISNMEGMLRRLLGEDTVEFCTELSPQSLPIMADTGQIEQVIMNLAVNARDAMPNGGRLTIETSNVTINHPFRQATTVLKPGRYVLLAVRDTGHGMDDDTKSHLFEPFFTTKEKGKGTGLGLSTVYGIVKQNQGGIVVDSKPGQGATFKIYFPLVEGTLKGVSGGSENSDAVHGRETILLVEDEPAVRGLVHETLQQHGYTVLDARHGIEALVTGAKHQGPIHLLLTDVVMPQMSGPEVAEKIQVLRPGIKILYMSGYPDHPAFEQGKITHETGFLPKPFAPNVLAKKVRDILDSVKAA